MRGTQIGITNRLLGYPDDARLLLINADDLGMYGAINEGVVRAFHEGVVRSTSLMMPCPGAAQAVALLRGHPDLPFGIHLSIVRDIDEFIWEPLTPKERIPSLLDETGHFYREQQKEEMLERARVDELELEFREQIETALATGLSPTHLDWHCLHSGGRADIFDLTIGLAKEYGLALRIGSQSSIDQVHRLMLPGNDHALLDSFDLSLDGKSERYIQLLRALPVGLTEWAVHPSLGSPDSQIIDPGGWQVRRTDFDFLVSPQARQVIEEEGIVLISYEPLQRVWRG